MATWLDLVAKPLVVYDYNTSTIDHNSYLVEENTIQSLRIYNRALTDEEILQNYQAGQCSPLLAMRGDIIG